MKIHTLKTPWLLTAMLVAVVIGELIARELSRTLGFRFDLVVTAAVCVGLVALVVSFLYDGDGRE